MKRGVVPHDHERVALGDDPALARDDVHHAAADRLAVHLRRRHAEGLRVRAARRHRARVRTRRSSSRRRCSTWIKEREPEYARRKDEDGCVADVQSVGGALAPDVAVATAEADASARRARGDAEPAPPVGPAPAGGAPSSAAPSDGASGARAARTAARAEPSGATRCATGASPGSYARYDGDGERDRAPRTRERSRAALELLLAGVGWAIAHRRGRRPTLADDLARRVGIERDEMRGAVRDAFTSWRAEAERLGARRDDAFEQGPRAARPRPPRGGRRSRAARRAARAPRAAARAHLRRGVAPRAPLRRAGCRPSVPHCAGGDSAPATAQDRPAVGDRARRHPARLRLPRSTAVAATTPRSSPTAAGGCARCSTSSGRRSSSSASSSRRARTCPAGHHRRAAQAAGRRHADPVRRGRGGSSRRSSG